MKKISSAILTLFLFCSLYAQVSIENPTHGLSTASNVHLQKIEVTDSATILSFKAFGRPGVSISIPQKTFIQPVGGEKLYITSTVVIPLGKWYEFTATNQVEYKLVFPKMAPAVAKFDYGEEDGSWFIYDINLAKIPAKIPKELSGHWFNEESGAYEFSFLDTLAIYNKQVWKYADTKLEKGTGKIVLQNGKQQVDVFVKIGKKGACKLGLSPQMLNNYTSDYKAIKTRPVKNDKPFEEPIFAMDSAIYHGFILGYTPRMGLKTGLIHVNDIITGQQNSFKGNIRADGYFYLKLPIYYPHEVYVRSALRNYSVFLEPGKELFQIITFSQKESERLFMGESAAINTQLGALTNISHINLYDLGEKVLDMSLSQYKAYCLDKKQAALTAFEKYKKDNPVSAKANQVVLFDIEYQTACGIMEYGWKYDEAYRIKNKIPRSQRALPVTIPQPTAEYYSFLANDLVNNGVAVVSNEYNSFINRVKYLNILRDNNQKGLTTLDIAFELEKAGYKFTPEEKILIDTLRLLDDPKVKAAQVEFNDKYGKSIAEFNKKYEARFAEVAKENKVKTVSFSMIRTHLEANGVQLTEEEIAMLEAIEKQNNTEEAKKRTETYKRIQPQINKFHADHKSFVNNFFQQKSIQQRNENLTKILGVKAGLASEIMYAQDICRPIVAESTPVTVAEMQTIQQQFTIPFIANYLAVCNQQTLAKLEANKNKTGYTVNETPKTEADKLFDSMMQKFRNKVVYVDFWATWCGPCRSGIERIKPLKDEMANENVVFVYITGPSSPQKTWENMIPDIKGEHYRVSEDEWNFLYTKFNISGIPHYAIVGKNGEIINPKLGHLENGALKAELLKHTK